MTTKTTSSKTPATRKTAASKTAASKTAASKTAASKTAAEVKPVPGSTTSLRDANRAEFNPAVRDLKKSVGAELAHTFAHLAWTTTATDPLTVSGTMSGNTRRNDAVAWLTAKGVIKEPITAQVAALVTALREAGADAAITDRLAGHYGVGDDLI